jgi:hypothetical protein
MKKNFQKRLKHSSTIISSNLGRVAIEQKKR